MGVFYVAMRLADCTMHQMVTFIFDIVRGPCLNKLENKKDKYIIKLDLNVYYLKTKNNYCC